jgi:hypothetical protein
MTQVFCECLGQALLVVVTNLLFDGGSDDFACVLIDVEDVPVMAFRLSAGVEQIGSVVLPIGHVSWFDVVAMDEVWRSYSEQDIRDDVAGSLDRFGASDLLSLWEVEVFWYVTLNLDVSHAGVIGRDDDLGVHIAHDVGGLDDGVGAADIAPTFDLHRVALQYSSDSSLMIWACHFWASAYCMLITIAGS